MIRLSVTDLDQYLYWLELEDAGPEWLIDRLTKFEPSPAMQAGSAFHAALELLSNSANLLVHEVVEENKTGELSWDDLADDYNAITGGRARTLPMEGVGSWAAAHPELYVVLANGNFIRANTNPRISAPIRPLDRRKYTFNIQCDAEISLPAQRELKIEREILPGIVLVGKIDALDGNRIVDYKLTERLDAERYLHSVQWRAYLMLFETNEFEYSIFEGSPDRGSTTRYTISGWHSLRFYSYFGMESDVKKVAVELAAFVQRHNITTKIS